MICKPASILLSAVAFACAAASSQAQSVLTHHVREVVQTDAVAASGRLASNQVMKLDIVLPLRNPNGLKTLLSQIYDPKSSSFHQFLTVSQFTAKFGPTQEDYDTVVEFAKSNGFTVTGGTRDGMEIQVKGPVSAVESAFHVSMLTYQHPQENRTFFSPDREPTTNLPFNLWHVSGLDNYSIPHPYM